jgi:TetR/AcrR family transcriptional regulator, transcriptional repressor for nem operon
MSKAERTRQFIIEQAALKFNEKGIAGTSVDDIIAVTKTSKGCFYGHFDSKEELSFASVDYLLNKVIDRRTSALSKHQTSIGKINAFLDLNKNPLNSYFDGGCPIVNLSTEADDTNPVIKKKLKSTIETAISLFTQILQDGIDSGELVDTLSANEFATRMFLSIEGGSAICRTLNSNKPMQIMISGLKAELASYQA